MVLGLKFNFCILLSHILLFVLINNITLSWLAEVCFNGLSICFNGPFYIFRLLDFDILYLIE